MIPTAPNLHHRFNYLPLLLLSLKKRPKNDGDGDGDGDGRCFLPSVSS